MEDKEIFKAWMAEMEWSKRGGIAKAAAALDKNRKTIERYRDGEAALPRETRLAMTALAQGLLPWDPKNEGVPAVHASISFGRS